MLVVSTTNYADKRIMSVSTANYADKRISTAKLRSGTPIARIRNCANYTDSTTDTRNKRIFIELVQRIAWISELSVSTTNDADKRIMSVSTANYADKRIMSVSTANYADKRIMSVSTANYADKRIMLVVSTANCADKRIVSKYNELRG